MKKIIVLSAVVLALSATSLFAAHETVRRRVKENIEINATPEAVWGIIKDFNRADTWQPWVKKVDAKGGNDKGAERILTLKDGGSITEKMKAYDAKKMEYKYKIIGISTSGTVFHAGNDISIPVLPVGNYSARIAVKKKGTGSLVSWNAHFYRAYPNNNPPAELTDQIAIQAVTGMLKAGLDNLKVMAESGEAYH